jgi:hypothetical protein
MHRLTRSLAIAGAAGLALVGGASLTGIAGAQEPDDPTTGATQPPADAPEGAPEDCGPGMGHRRGPNLDVAAEAIGIPVDELREALQGGQTLAEVAADHGVDEQVVVDALVADIEDHLAERVADGDITQEQADERLAEAEEHVTERVENGRPEGERPPRGERPADAPDAPADAPAGS